MVPGSQPHEHINKAALSAQRHVALVAVNIVNKLVYLSAVNADVQGTAKWIELNQTGNSCASVQSNFQAVVACYACCALDITRQQQLTFTCMGNRLLGLQMFLRSSFQGLG